MSLQNKPDHIIIEINEDPNTQKSSNKKQSFMNKHKVKALLLALFAFIAGFVFISTMDIFQNAKTPNRELNASPAHAGSVREKYLCSKVGVSDPVAQQLSQAQFQQNEQRKTIRGDQETQRESMEDHFDDEVAQTRTKEKTQSLQIIENVKRENMRDRQEDEFNKLKQLHQITVSLVAHQMYIMYVPAGKSTALLIEDPECTEKGYPGKNNCKFYRMQHDKDTNMGNWKSYPLCAKKILIGYDDSGKVWMRWYNEGTDEIQWEGDKTKLGYRKHYDLKEMIGIMPGQNMIEKIDKIMNETDMKKEWTDIERNKYSKFGHNCFKFAEAMTQKLGLELSERHQQFDSAAAVRGDPEPLAGIDDPFWF